MGRLNHGRIKSLMSPGLDGDGDTLNLRVTPGGSKSWINLVAINGRRRDIGLGGWPVVSLARARQRAFTNRVAISEGRDPLAEKRNASMPERLQRSVSTATQKRVVSSRHRRTPRGGKRKMSNYPLRPRHAPTRTIDINATIKIAE